VTDCLMQSCFCFWFCDDGLLSLWPRSSLSLVGEAVKDVRKEMAEIATTMSTNAVIRLFSLLLFL